MKAILEGSKLLLLNKHECDSHTGGYRHDVRYLKQKDLIDKPFYLIATINHHLTSHIDYIVYVHGRKGICNNLDWLADRIKEGRAKFNPLINESVPWGYPAEVERKFSGGSVMVIASMFFMEVDTNTQAKVLLKTEVD